MYSLSTANHLFTFSDSLYRTQPYHSHNPSCITFSTCSREELAPPAIALPFHQSFSILHYPSPRPFNPTLPRYQSSPNPHYHAKFVLWNLIFRERQARSPTNFGTILLSPPIPTNHLFTFSDFLYRTQPYHSHNPYKSCITFLTCSRGGARSSRHSIAVSSILFNFALSLAPSVATNPATLSILAKSSLLHNKKPPYHSDTAVKLYTKITLPSYRDTFPVPQSAYQW